MYNDTKTAQNLDEGSEIPIYFNKDTDESARKLSKECTTTQKTAQNLDKGNEIPNLDEDNKIKMIEPNFLNAISEFKNTLNNPDADIENHQTVKTREEEK